MPPAITASTGLDAITQLMEVYVSKKANPLTDGICREGLLHAGRSLLTAFENGNDTSAREDMALASLFGGLGLANAGLGAVHGFAGPLGGMISAGHGDICAALLPFVMEANVQALKNRRPDSTTLWKYDEIARILTDDKKARAADGAKWVRELCSALHVRPLSLLGLKEQDIPDAVAKACKSSSMKGNPIELTEEELMEILKKAL
jgi:alcohol dehydrogenase class IV